MNSREFRGIEENARDLEDVLELKDTDSLVFRALALPGIGAELEERLTESLRLASPLFCGVTVEQIQIDHEIGQVSVQISIDENAKQASIESIARFISNVSGLAVDVRSEVDQVELPSPPEIPVRLSGMYPEPLVDQAMIQAAAYDVTPEEFQYLPARDNQRFALERLTREFPFKSVTVSDQDGIWEIRAPYSPRILSHKWYQDFTHQVAEMQSADEVGPVRIALEHRLPNLFTRVCKMLGHDFPWNHTVERDKGIVRVKAAPDDIELLLSTTPDLPEQFLAKTGYQIEFDRYQTERAQHVGEYFFPPISRGGVSSGKLSKDIRILNQSLPKFLFAGDAFAEHGSNTITVPYAAKNLPQDVVWEAFDEIAGLSFPVRFKPTLRLGDVSTTQAILAVDEMVNRFPFDNPIVFGADEEGLTVQYHNHDPVEDSHWYQEASAALAELADFCGQPIRLHREVLFEQLYDVIAEELNTNIRWRIAESDEQAKHCVLELDDLHSFTPSDALHRIIQRTGWSVEFRENDFSHEWPSMIAFSRARSLEGLTYADAVAAEEMILKVLPVGLGDCAVQLDGNRIRVAAETRNLPAPFYANIANEMSRFVVPVELRQGGSATLKPDYSTFKDIVQRSLPAHDYLCSLEESETGWEASVLRLKSDASNIYPLERELSRCAGKPVAIRYVDVKKDFHDYLSELPDEAVQFFVEVCNEEGVVDNPQRFSRKFEEHFQLQTPSVASKDREIEGERVDLTELMTRAIDKRGTGVVEDALSWSLLRNGNLELAIHIVDPTWMFEFGSTTDNEAMSRGMSDQGRGYRIPLIRDDEVVYQSSFRPKTDRAAITLFVELSPDGEEVGYRFERSKIRLDYRSDFEEVDSFLKGKASGVAAGRYRLLHKYMKPYIQAERERGVNFGPQSESQSRQLVAATAYLFDRLVAEHLSENGVPYPALVQEAPSFDTQREVIEKARSYGFVGKSQVTEEETLQALHHLSEKMPRFGYKRVMATLTTPATFEAGGEGKHFSMNSRLASSTKPLKSYASLVTIRALERSLRGAAPISELHMNKIVHQLNEGRRHRSARSVAFRDIKRFYDLINKEGGQSFGQMSSRSSEDGVEFNLGRLGSAVAKSVPSDVRPGSSALCIVTGYDFIKRNALVEVL